MKTKVLALFAAVTGLAAATAAHAESRVFVHFGLGAPIYRPAEPVYVAPEPVYVAPQPCGHWENVTTRTWVPARHTETRDAWGRCVTVVEPGHYVCTTNRVWVEDRPRHACGYDNRHNRWDRDDGDDDYDYGWDYRRR